MIIHASISNVLFIYRRKGYTDAVLSNKELQQRLGLQLLRNPASVSRKLEIKKPPTKRASILIRPLDEHEWERTTHDATVRPVSHRGQHGAVGQHYKRWTQIHKESDSDSDEVVVPSTGVGSVKWLFASQASAGKRFTTTTTTARQTQARKIRIMTVHQIEAFNYYSS
jgi:hypothetical protein